ncbi:MAG TPA: hypothetical protein VJN90_13130 [Candidatus Acidoferrales bacterium]|nr:hypothetical protein [Candidatus Acidoferrales bacterium]
MRPFNSRYTDRGFALIFVLFLVALLIVTGSVVFVNRLTEGKRQKEAVTIWRGEQYERAIGLYYRKFGRFPTSVDDLVKAQNGIRFLREAYKNPMNKEDGSWRFIYVTPAGQLIGSVRYTTLQQMAFLDKQRQMGITTGVTAAGTSGIPVAPPDNSSAQALSQPPPTGQPSAQQGVLGGSGVAADVLPGAPPATLGPQGGQPPVQQPVQPFFSQDLRSQTPANPGISVTESSNSSGSGPVIGGFIIGVAGKSDKSSIKVYKGGATYKEWEFIFNPLEQVQTIGTISTAPAQKGTQPPGTTPPFGMPQPQPQPPQPPQS